MTVYIIYIFVVLNVKNLACSSYLILILVRRKEGQIRDGLQEHQVLGMWPDWNIMMVAKGDK